MKSTSDLIRVVGNPVIESSTTGWCVPDPRWCAWNLRRIQVNENVGPILLFGSAADSFRGVLRVSSVGWIKEIYGWSPRHKMLDSSRGLSTHAFGLAVDINPGDNPYGESSTNIPPDFIQAMKRRGWVWGGDWAEPDPMHFQLERF